MPRRTNAQIWDDLRREGKLKDLVAKSRRDWENIPPLISAQGHKLDVAIKAEDDSSDATSSQLELAAHSDVAKAVGHVKPSKTAKLDVTIKDEFIRDDKTPKFTAQQDVAAQQGFVASPEARSL